MGLTRLSEANFLVKGFTNWKDATRVLVKHENSNFLKATTEALKATNDVADMLSQAAATEALKATNDLADMLSQAAATEALKATNDTADMLSKAAATEALKATNDMADMLSKAAATEALKATNDVADMSKAAATEKKKNHVYLLKIISSLRFLGRQGLPSRGDGSHNDLDSILSVIAFESRGLSRHKCFY